MLNFSSSFDKHLVHLDLAFQTLRQAGLKLKPEKCHFAKRKLHYLGHVIRKDGVEADPAKVSKVRNMPPPKSVSELRTFLGIAKYYRRLVKGYSSHFIPCCRKVLTTSGLNNVKNLFKVSKAI